MTDEKKTRIIAVASWVLPIVALSVAPLAAIFAPPREIEDSAVLRRYVVIFLSTLFTPLIAGFVLSLVARRRSRLLHNGRFAGHARAGFFLSLPMLVCYAAVFAYLLFRPL